MAQCDLMQSSWYYTQIIAKRMLSLNIKIKAKFQKISRGLGKRNIAKVLTVFRSVTWSRNDITKFSIT